MRILFMGTPDIAADCLKALYEAGHRSEEHTSELQSRE